MSEEQVNWTMFQTADNEALARMLEERLQQAGIPVVLIPGDAASYMGASSPYLVNVPAGRLAEAKELLDD